MHVKNKMKIGTKLRLLLTFLVLSLLVTALIAFWSAHKFVDQIDNLGEVQLPGTSNMILVDMMHDGIRANVLQAIIISHSTDAAEKKSVKEESVDFARSIHEHIANLQKLNLHHETKLAINPAIPRIEEYVKSAQEIVDIALSGDEAKARASLPKFNEKFEALEKELKVLGELIEKDAAESTKKGAAIEADARNFNIASLLIGIGLLIFFAMVIRDQQNQLKLIIDNLNIETKRINETAANISSSAQGLSQSASQQSSIFQMSASAILQIGKMIRSTEANSKQLNQNSKISSDSTAKGKQTVEKMLSSMSSIEQSNALMMKEIENGNIRIRSIVQVISEIETKTKVINDIVFQTKLLSFNASVEAARAGEQGKGFAVVAEEVGKLAQMSGNAAKEISDMLSSSIHTVESIVNDSKSKIESMTVEGRQSVKQGILIANNCGDALEEIVAQTSNIGTLISEITNAAREQSAGIGEVSSAMELLDQASQQNSQISDANINSSKALQDQVVNLENVIDSLTTMMTTSATKKAA